MVIDKLSFIHGFIIDYASIIKILSARRAEKEREALQGHAAQKKDGEAAGSAASPTGGDGGAELSKSRAPKSCAPASVASTSVAPGQGSNPQSMHATGVHKSASTLSAE